MYNCTDVGWPSQYRGEMVTVMKKNSCSIWAGQCTLKCVKLLKHDFSFTFQDLQKAIFWVFFVL